MGFIQKIALVQCPCNYSETPPINLAVLTSSLKGQHKIIIFDFDVLFFYKKKKYLFNLWKRISAIYYFFDLKIFQNLSFFCNKKIIEKWTSKILDSNPDVVGLTISRNNLLFSICLAKKLKEKKQHLIIIVGGAPCHMPFLKRYKILLNSPYVDIIIEGEGGNELRTVLDDLEIGRKIKHVIRSKPIDINTLSPDYSQLNLNDYPNQMYITGSKSCNRNCHFCIEPKLRGPYQEKNLQGLLNEIIFLKNKYNISSFAFTDSLINVSLPRLEKFCDYLIKNRIKINWRGGSVIKEGMNYPLFKKMKKAGCYALLYGLESGCDTVLKKMNKGYNIKLAEEVIRDSKKANIIVDTNWIVNFPNETWFEFIKTLKFIWKNRTFIDTCSVSNYGITPESYVQKNYKKFDLKSDKLTFFWKSKHSNFMDRLMKYFIFNIYISILGKKKFKKFSCTGEKIKNES